MHSPEGSLPCLSPSHPVHTQRDPALLSMPLHPIFVPPSSLSSQLASSQSEPARKKARASFAQSSSSHATRGDHQALCGPLPSLLLACSPSSSHAAPNACWDRCRRTTSCLLCTSFSALPPSPEAAPNRSCGPYPRPFSPAFFIPRDRVFLTVAPLTRMGWKRSGKSEFGALPPVLLLLPQCPQPTLGLSECSVIWAE